MTVTTRSLSKSMLSRKNNSMMRDNRTILIVSGIIGMATVGSWLAYDYCTRPTMFVDSEEPIKMIQGSYNVKEGTSLTVMDAGEQDGGDEAVNPSRSWSVPYGTMVAALLLFSFGLCVALKRSVDACRLLRRGMADKVFEMETLQATMTMLESELERKILQPNRPQCELFGSKYVMGDGGREVDGGGDMIPAGWGVQESSCVLGDDAVESFLQDRGALAIQEEQVDRWVRLEEEYDVLKKELKELKDILQLHNPGDKRSKTEKIHEAIFLLDSMNLE